MGLIFVVYSSVLEEQGNIARQAEMCTRLVNDKVLDAALFPVARLAFLRKLGDYCFNEKKYSESRQFFERAAGLLSSMRDIEVTRSYKISISIGLIRAENREKNESVKSLINRLVDLKSKLKKVPKLVDHDKLYKLLLDLYKQTRDEKSYLKTLEEFTQFCLDRLDGADSEIERSFISNDFFASSVILVKTYLTKNDPEKAIEFLSKARSRIAFPESFRNQIPQDILLEAEAEAEAKAKK